mmetsp:Transcript_762/g.1904  ORF Transcript_762/g.1904 Transcript_762/m.1904 type:complete len:143 (-) Transcript_762:47-475(-)
MASKELTSEGAMAEACSGPILEFMACNCTHPVSSPDRCSKQLCGELENSVRECANRNLVGAFQEVEMECDSQLSSFVKCVAVSSPSNWVQMCQPVRGPLEACARKVLGNRAPFFIGGLNNPAGLVNYRVTTGKTAIDEDMDA